jgi:hypothetical protein
MFGWVEDSLHEAINCLARLGKNDLASDLTRLVGTLDFDELEIFRVPMAKVIAEELTEVGSFPDFVDLMRQFADAIGVSHCTLHVVSEVPSAGFTTRALTTFPEEWIARYFDRRYFTHDPVHRACLTATSGFFWDSLNAEEPAMRTFCRDARAHGIGPSGYSLPIITERGDKIAVSVSSRERSDAFRDRIHYVEHELNTVAFCLSEAFSRLASEDRPTEFSVTDDQLMVLRRVAMGSGEEDLRNATYQFGSYATLERSICSLFRTRNIAQAAIIAARVGLLTNTPLTKADILVGSNRMAPGRSDVASNAALRRLARMRKVLTEEKALIARNGREGGHSRE